ncbi:hypothetical protein F5Y18DRAFT_368414 [Xylariaceae sp. FL1019]|nr:hypothetical protein F5Y18DRAFT_368414 [Xylariaceae sp. FL1019]
MRRHNRFVKRLITALPRLPSLSRVRREASVSTPLCPILRAAGFAFVMLLCLAFMQALFFIFPLDRHSYLRISSLFSPFFLLFSFSPFSLFVMDAVSTMPRLHCRSLDDY